MLSSLLRQPRDSTTGFTELDEWITALQRLGWTGERIRLNELPASSTSAEFTRFWLTAIGMNGALLEAGVPHFFIKCRRRYHYVDSNVDVVVAPGSLRRAVAALTSSAWKLPSRSSRLEQRLVERGKMKLPPRTPDLVLAHVYAGVRWRYQSPLALTISPSDQDELLEQIDPMRLAGIEGPTLLHSGPALDLLIHAAHIVFENYRMTIGEAADIALLHREPGVTDEARQLARAIGCTKALEVVTSSSSRTLLALAHTDPRHFPRDEPLSGWLRAIGERFRHLAGRHPWQALYESATSVQWYAALRAYRAARKAVHGSSSRRGYAP